MVFGVRLLLVVSFFSRLCVFWLEGKEVILLDLQSLDPPVIIDVEGDEVIFS